MSFTKTHNFAHKWIEPPPGTWRGLVPSVNCLYMPHQRAEQFRRSHRLVLLEVSTIGWGFTATNSRDSPKATTCPSAQLIQVSFSSDESLLNIKNLEDLMVAYQKETFCFSCILLSFSPHRSWLYLSSKLFYIVVICLTLISFCFQKVPLGASPSLGVLQCLEVVEVSWEVC